MFSMITVGKYTEYDFGIFKFVQSCFVTYLMMFYVFFR